MKQYKRPLIVVCIVIVLLVIIMVLLKACQSPQDTVNRTAAVAPDQLAYVDDGSDDRPNNTNGMLVGAAVGYVVGSAINNVTKPQSQNSKVTMPVRQATSPKTKPILVKTQVKPKPKMVTSKPIKVNLTKSKPSKVSLSKSKSSSKSSTSKSRK